MASAGVGTNIRVSCRKEASLTVEAALVLPLFLYLILTFLYFIQIVTIQEYIQSTITKMGLNFAKTAYIYEDFAGATDALNFDATILGVEFDIGLGDFAASVIDKTILKTLSRSQLDTDRINSSCIVDGFRGISFDQSSILQNEDCIDIVVSYRVKLPIKLFSIETMELLQRVKVRGWTGYEVAPAYSLEEEEEAQEEYVYITKTGTVYHTSPTCSHIHLSIKAVSGIPDSYRNDNGGKYYPCKECSKGKIDPLGTYYITTDGSSYHTSRDCSALKRTVKKILLSEIGSRSLCKRCSR